MPRRGYRFIAPVVAEEVNGIAPPPIDAMRNPLPGPRADAERRQITALSCELIGTPGGADGIGLEDLRDAPRKGRSAEEVEARLLERGVRLVVYAGWTSIDECERVAGEPLGRPRVKLCTWDELLAAAGLEPSAPRV